jgi:hypothetical protein
MMKNWIYYLKFVFFSLSGLDFTGNKNRIDYK